MGRRREAFDGFDCPYRHQCPHLDGMSAQWLMEEYHECDELRRQMEEMEREYERRIEQLEKAVADRDRKIAQLQVQHRKQFKKNRTADECDGSKPLKVKVKRRGAPKGHPYWHRREPDHVDQVVQVDAPRCCPRCGCKGLLPHPEEHEHVQEDIVLTPRTLVIRFVHQQSFCPNCRRAVYQAAEGELPGCAIGPLTRAVATHLRYDLQIPYRKVRRILSLFGMRLVTTTAMNFDRKATALGLPLYEDLLAKLKSSQVAYADETGWREDGQGHFVWFAGNRDLAVYRITDNRASDSAVQLLGEQFDGTVVSDDYAAYDAVQTRSRQTCWNHLRTRAREIIQQIELLPAETKRPARSLKFCGDLSDFALRMCALGRKMRHRKLSLRKARQKVPSLRRQLKRIGRDRPDWPAAQTLRQRVLVKDWDKLFTFLRVKGVEPTNNHSERSLRFLVIMRKVCFGTRSAAGSKSHGVLASLLQTAKCQGKDPVAFLFTLLTRPADHAKAALFARGP